MRLALAVGSAVLVLLATAAGSHSRPNPLWYSGPVWSHDGKHIALFGTTSSGIVDLYVMDAEGSGLRRLAFSSTAPARSSTSGVSWSPDDRRLAYNTFEGIVVLRADGKDKRLLVKGGSPAWSPGGKRIAFSHGASEEGDPNLIYAITPDGRTRQLVAEDPDCANLQSPSWSPDGKRMVFTRAPNPECGSGGGGLGITGSFGSTPGIVERGRALDDPAWSPIRNELAVTDIASPTSYAVSIYDLARKTLVRLHAGQHPSWSPDGSRIVFDDEGAVFVINRGGSSPKKLVG
jgi:Tol biopolymer transport system component